MALSSSLITLTTSNLQRHTQSGQLTPRTKVIRYFNQIEDPQILQTRGQSPIRGRKSLSPWDPTKTFIQGYSQGDGFMTAVAESPILGQKVLPPSPTRKMGMFEEGVVLQVFDSEDSDIITPNPVIAKRVPFRDIGNLEDREAGDEIRTVSEWSESHYNGTAPNECKYERQSRRKMVRDPVTGEFNVNPKKPKSRKRKAGSKISRPNTFVELRPLDKFESKLIGKTRLSITPNGRAWGDVKDLAFPKLSKLGMKMLRKENDGLHPKGPKQTALSKSAKNDVEVDNNQLSDYFERATKNDVCPLTQEEFNRDIAKSTQLDKRDKIVGNETGDRLVEAIPGIVTQTKEGVKELPLVSISSKFNYPGGCQTTGAIQQSAETINDAPQDTIPQIRDLADSQIHTTSATPNVQHAAGRSLNMSHRLQSNKGRPTSKGQTRSRSQERIRVQPEGPVVRDQTLPETFEHQSSRPTDDSSDTGLAIPMPTNPLTHGFHLSREKTQFVGEADVPQSTIPSLGANSALSIQPTSQTPFQIPSVPSKTPVPGQCSAIPGINPTYQALHTKAPSVSATRSVSMPTEREPPYVNQCIPPGVVDGLVSTGLNGVGGSQIILSDLPPPRKCNVEEPPDPSQSFGPFITAAAINRPGFGTRPSEQARSAPIHTFDRILFQGSWGNYPPPGARNDVLVDELNQVISEAQPRDSEVHPVYKPLQPPSLQRANTLGRVGDGLTDDIEEICSSAGGGMRRAKGRSRDSPRGPMFNPNGEHNYYSPQRSKRKRTSWDDHLQEETPAEEERSENSFGISTLWSTDSGPTSGKLMSQSEPLGRSNAFLHGWTTDPLRIIDQPYWRRSLLEHQRSGRYENSLLDIGISPELIFSNELQLPFATQRSDRARDWGNETYWEPHTREPHYRPLDISDILFDLSKPELDDEE